MTKKVIILSALITLIMISACIAENPKGNTEDGINWFTNLEEAQKLAQEKNIPIETFDEALIELNFINSSFFKTNGSEAQANIANETLLELFADEIELIN